ncbi:internal virion protein B [Pectobacterium phage vB_PcaP_P15_PC2B6]|uniref:Internal virion protein gp14 n=1 Tax=Pectobacterium phage vB_PcaP_P15_PC2B6 TaxID=2968434 RepID=A0AAX3BQE2_9CAUD|nr:internal virion protein B [Pectobacterium phage vB_PcaP_P15_PC2B6]
MCWMVAIPIAMAAMQMVSSGQQANQAAASANDQSRRQALQMVKELNWKDADAQMQQQDTLDAAANQLTQNNMTNVQNMGMIRATLGESMLTGNSMNRIANVTEGDMIRANNAVSDQYTRDYASIFASRVGNRESTISQIEAMKASEAKVKGPLEQIIDPLGIGLGKAAKWATGGNPMFKGLTSKALDTINSSDKKSTGG